MKWLATSYRMREADEKYLHLISPGTFGDSSAVTAAALVIASVDA